MHRLILPVGLCLVGLALTSIGIIFLQVRLDITGEIVDSVVNPLGETFLALDSQGRPHISYNSISPSMLKYAVKSDQEWSFEVVDSSGWKHSFRLDSNNKPHIVYLVHGLNELRYAFRNAENWIKETVASLVEGSPSLALDSNNNPHISYVAYGWIRYTFKENENWYAENVVEGYSPAVSLVLEQGGIPHIIFREQVSGDDCLVKHAFKSGGNWTVETVDAYKAEGFGGFETFSSLIDIDNNLHIAYPSEHGLKYAVKRNNVWTTEVVDGDNWGAYNSLVLDSTGNPHISYMGRNTTPKDPLYYISVNCAVKQNGMWSIKAIAPGGTTAGKFSATSLTLDSDEKLHLSYYFYEDEYLMYYSETSSHNAVTPNFAQNQTSFVLMISGIIVLLIGIGIVIKRKP